MHYTLEVTRSKSNRELECPDFIFEVREKLLNGKLSLYSKRRNQLTQEAHEIP
jgi:hypothetical protein